MEEGSVVKVRLPQPDGSSKSRPVLLLKRMSLKYDDFLLCAISSQLHQYRDGFDELIDEQHPDFNKSGLLAPSVIRLGVLMTLSSRLIEGAWGKISSETHQLLLERLSSFLKEKAS